MTSVFVYFQTSLYKLQNETDRLLLVYDEEMGCRLPGRIQVRMANTCVVKLLK